MKTRFLFVAALIFCTVTISFAAKAQESESFRKSFSLELGAGIFPFHATLGDAGRAEEAEYAKLGQRISSSDKIAPAFSLSEVWRTGEHWEFCLTEGVSWKWQNVTQYGVFGTDPNGDPRYDLTKVTDTWVKASKPVFSLTAQVRFIWSPNWKVTVYSATEIGISSNLFAYFYTPLSVPLPGITPVAVRYGGKHLYGFAELILGPIASFGHGGLGWRF